MCRAARLQSARHWLAGYRGKHIVRSYARWFGVDLLCAARELQTLGVQVSPEYLEQLRVTASQPRRRRATRAAANDKHATVEPMSDGRFAYIAGYTPAGFPFGVTWEELEGASDGHTRSGH